LSMSLAPLVYLIRSKMSFIQ